MSRDNHYTTLFRSLAEIKLRLDQLEAMLREGPYAAGSAFTLADCSLAPLMFYAQLTLQLLGAPPFTEGRPKVTAWWTAVQQRASVQRVHAERMEAVRQMQEAVLQARTRRADASRR